MATVEIPLSQGQAALVDEEDVPLLGKIKWHVHRHRNGAMYATGRIRGVKKKILMHRLLLGVTDGVEVDHKDGNGLNNTRDNLRVCTRTQNMRNTRKRRSLSKFKGVAFQKDRPKTPWMAGIFCGKKFNLGRYATEEEAAKAYDAAAAEFFGEFAKLNFPQVNV